MDVTFSIQEADKRSYPFADFLRKNFCVGRYENALRCALGNFSGILFIFANRENLRIFPIGLFTGGSVAENDIYNNYYRLSKMQK